MVYTFLSEIEDLMTAVENFVIFHQTVDLDLFRVVLSRQLLWELKGVILPKRLQSKQVLKVVSNKFMFVMCNCGTFVFVAHLCL